METSENKHENERPSESAVATINDATRKPGETITDAVQPEETIPESERCVALGNITNVKEYVETGNVSVFGPDEEDDITQGDEPTDPKALIDLSKIGERERRHLAAELLSRGLQPKQVRRALGLKKRQLDEWITTQSFRNKVEFMLQSRIVKAEQAKAQADAMLLKGGEILQVMMASVLNLSQSIAKKVIEAARNPKYEFHPRDQATAMTMLGMYRELRKEIETIQTTNIFLNEGSDGPPPLADGWTNKAGVRVIKLVEKTKELAAREGISLEEAQRIVLANVDVLGDK